MLVSVLLVGCARRAEVYEPSDKIDEQENQDDSEDLSEYEPDLIGEDEVDIGEMV